MKKFILILCLYVPAQIVLSQIRNTETSSTIRVSNAGTSTLALVYWEKAPNSYIFDPTNPLNGDGLYIPVKKAYVMWKSDAHIGGSPIPDGTLSADVLWEDKHGLIKSGADYSLEIIGTGESAKIKVPINTSKEGNAVIAFKVNGVVYWSWHVWVTDNPTNGSTYKSFPDVKKEIKAGLTETIPDTEWQWMDRNLGAISSSIAGEQWNKNGGLLYQWGRKDPIPPLALKGDDFYEVSGSLGRVRHRQARNFSNAANFDSFTKYVTLSNASVQNNIRLSVNNPLSLIYVNKDDNSGPAYYNNNANIMVNWFGTSSTLDASRLTELNLWSDNSKGIISTSYQNDSDAAPYREKSSFDPCPNGWRIPSMLVANLASLSYTDDIRVDFSPFGPRTDMGKSDFDANMYHIIKPNDNDTPGFIAGRKVYANIGMDFSDVGGFDMGTFPGTGLISRITQDGQYTDMHHTALWTATMTRHFDTTPAVNARALSLLPDKDQPDIPDSGLPSVKGRYLHEPLNNAFTSDALGCRCIKDPLYITKLYDFPTEFFTEESSYTEGMYSANSYQEVKQPVSFSIEIPVSKAFSVQSQLLGNEDILDPSSFNNLKTNVLWTTNTGLISNVSLSNPYPSSLSEISETKINVNINPNQSGNAVITLHNGSITNPVYWSWHIWITDTPVSSYVYTTEQPDNNAPNYINYVENGKNILSTEFMDRNIGAVDAFPVVANPLTPNSTEIAQIKASGGLHYQWGRKDPLPVFQNAYDTGAYNIFLGTTDVAGNVSYTTLTGATYNTLGGNYIIPYATYANSENVTSTDKPAEKISKILSYSVKNPLVYMIPSTLAGYNPAAPLHTNGTDWLAEEPNLESDRWGRATVKSPFDPCPEGWRIPDVIYTATSASNNLGITPWYKKNKIVTTAYNIMTDYLGTRVRNGTTGSTVGYLFQNTEYNIGNYPKSGSRGSRNVTSNNSTEGTFNSINFQYPQVWTAALNSNYIGRPIGVLFDVASTANRMTVYHDNNDPYFAASCRCVKIKYDADGKEVGPVDPNLLTGNRINRKGASSVVEKHTEEVNTEGVFSVYPNPVTNILNIKAGEKQQYGYEIFDASGKLVKTGTFISNQTDVSGLLPGIYFIKIEQQGIVKIIKK
ncbi:MAG: T9SS type A sorting domain-containing protein [Bergeyella sp.]